MKKSIIVIAFALPVLLFSSCEDYLERTQASDLTEEQIFGSYQNFTGFLDQLYGNKLIKYIDAANCTCMDMADDVYGSKNFIASYTFPQGDYWWVWSNTWQNMIVCSSQNTTDKYSHGIWEGWGQIRVCNQGLANLDYLVGATEEQVDLIKGQLYFFRAWYHFEIARFWGGIPYVDSFLQPDDNLRLPRLSFKETLLKIVEDLDKAAACLPVDWNQTAQGQAAPNAYLGRVTKGAALALKARAYLYAGSPLTVKEETGVAMYDPEMCELAAKAAYEVIELADQGVYELVEWEDYPKNFINNSNTQRVVYTKEYIWYKFCTDRGSGQLTRIGNIYNSQRFEGKGQVSAPTQNMVDMYETRYGLPITDPDSHYDPMHPWSNRDPRLLQTILVDGVKWVEGSISPAADAYVQLYSTGGSGAGNGADMNSGSGSLTGYLNRKYIPYKCNKYDKGYANYQFNVPYIRLAEMYLTYAEALNEVVATPTTVPDWAPLSPVDAVNIIRRRVKLPMDEDVTKPYELYVYGSESLPDMAEKFTTDRGLFRERVRNERSVELSYEGHRWHDIRRWYIAHEDAYKVRYKGVFDKNHTYFNKEVVCNGVFEQKHYWLPFKRSDVQQYAAFKQNPGW